MKTKVLYGFIISIFLSMTSCSRAEESGAQKGTSLIEKTDSLQDKKVLIVYLSRTKKHQSPC